MAAVPVAVVPAGSVVVVAVVPVAGSVVVVAVVPVAGSVVVVPVAGSVVVVAAGMNAMAASITACTRASWSASPAMAAAVVVSAANTGTRAGVVGAHTQSS